MCTCPSKCLILWTCTWLCQYWLDGGIYIYTPPPPVYTYIYTNLHPYIHVLTLLLRTPLPHCSHTHAHRLSPPALLPSHERRCVALPRVVVWGRRVGVWRRWARLPSVSMWYQCVAVCCSVVQCGAAWCSVLQCGEVGSSVECLYIIWVSPCYMSVSILYDCLNIIWVSQYYMSVSILYECFNIIWVSPYYTSVCILYHIIWVSPYDMSVSLFLYPFWGCIHIISSTCKHFYLKMSSDVMLKIS